ncbi:MAG TPA: ribose 5-phosphate isomerase B [Candidatus Bathyarchaeia archaeon]|nr:ribose 5-phosphate isomerase B [Candidatus Bathyarchaeia archaeon]
MTTFILGSDHAGYRIKQFIERLLVEKCYAVEDVGTWSTASVDYPDFAEKLALRVRGGRDRKGILTCGTGIGASIAANKIPGIRAALVCNVRDARLSIEHNNANVLVLGGRPFDRDLTRRIVNMWLRSSFQGGRHLRRIRKIAAIEAKFLSR